MGNAICGKCGENKSKRKIIKNETKIEPKEEKGETKLKPAPKEMLDKLKKSICKIIIRKKDEEIINVTGFFIKISEVSKYLLINYQITNQENISGDIEIEIWNKGKINLNLKERNIKYFEKNKELIAIKLKEDDDIIKNIEFLSYDLNYKKGNLLYKYKDVFTIKNPFKDDSSCFLGIILNINNKEFDHNIPTENDSLGCPIILLNNNIDFLQVIGIHKISDDKTKINKGIFINEIINELKKDDNNITNINIKVESKIDLIEQPKDILKENAEIIDKKSNLIEMMKDEENKIKNEIENLELNLNKNPNENDNDAIINNNNNNEHIINNNINNNNIINNNDNINLNKPKGNYINTEIFIKEEDINKSIRIINSYEEYLTSTKSIIDIKNISEETKNQKEIKQCEIRINNELIPFNYFYEFTQSKKYSIKYTFNSLLKNVHYLFYNCSSLISIDLSNLDFKNITDISYMLYQCSSLINIDSSYLNSQKVKNMRYAFCNCSSLINIDLTHFNTQNVEDMCGMFSGCEVLADINLSFFNTQNVKIMNHMFSFCSSLIDVDLSCFNFNNVKFMCYMFYKCSGLESINLSNFNSEIIGKLEHYCLSKDFSCVFKEFNSLKGNVITNDEKIKELIN